MSRVDIPTLVMAFENRIAALNKNPPELVSQKTISLMLESAVEEEIKNHFTTVIKVDIKEALQKEFKKLRVKLIKDILKDLLTDSNFRQSVENKIKKSIIDNIK